MKADYEAIPVTDLKTALQNIFPELPKCPSNTKYNSIAELYDQYRETLEGTFVTDKCGNQIYFLAESFPHLVKLEYFDRKQKGWVEAVAGPTMEHLKNKRLDESRFRIQDTSRPRTLLWIPEVISSSDTIHDHKSRPELDIYVRQYKRDKGLDPIKLVLVETRKTGERVVKTSFWTNEQYLKNCAVMPAKHPTSK
jgi:hypothetical protein